ncbi:MAG: 3-dehydroquinate synthase [Ruminococcaceae bacterium]|nr:3-dehydroquinate synthase [Oscillospiraceae bacterium]
MKTIEVRASSTYNVLIGSGLLDALGEQIKKVCNAAKAAVISDSNVFPIYGDTVTQSLRSAGFDVVHFVFPAGEESKNGHTFLEIINFLAENHLTRTDCLIALGGGVVGDVTGFAAAVYLRGIAYIQVPTTLLAAVDSSVGGKTAIDLPAGKNLCGAFYQPRLVLCDIDTLDTLPVDIFRDGCAEVIKYGILYDNQLFSTLEHSGLQFDREAVISRCVELKRDVVAEDEFDTGSRMKLNLGHTVGHGVEACSEFQISHGKAVAIGTAIVSRAALASGLCDNETRDRILSILEQFELPTTCSYSPEVLMDWALSDKKRAGDTVNLIIPRSIGHCDIVPSPVANLLSFIKAGLSYGHHHPPQKAFR